MSLRTRSGLRCACLVKVCWLKRDNFDGVVKMRRKMAESKLMFRSTVADIIDFQPLENPPWRAKTSLCPSTQDMIKDIANFKQNWDLKIDSVDSSILNDVRQKLEAKFFHHCNVDEDHGLKDLKRLELFLKSSKDSGLSNSKKLSLEEQETLNVRDAYVFLQEQAELETKECRGLLEESMLRKTNMIILRKIPIAKSSTKPGIYSNKPRMTTFNGETYFYQQPEDMMAAVCTLLDRYNSLFTQSMNLPSMEERLENVFKSVAWLVFELLDLHPFSDGNGRLCRLLCCYVLSALCPFPSPMYNMYSESSIQDFEQILVATRQSADRKPVGLTTMIIESNWATWKKLKKIEQEITNKQLSNVSYSDTQLDTLRTVLPRTCSNSVTSSEERNFPVEHKVGA